MIAATSDGGNDDSSHDGDNNHVKGGDDSK